MCSVAQVAADLHKHISWNRFACAVEALSIKLKRWLKLSRLQRGAAEPELRPPASKQRCHPTQRIISRGFPATFVVNCRIPMHSIFLIWIDFQSVPQSLFRRGAISSFRLRLSQVGKNDTFLPVL